MRLVTFRFPLVLCILALLSASSAPAAVVTVSYVNGVISTTSNFAAGTTTGVNLNLPVNMAAGQFFRFGVALSISGNPDPEFGTQYAADALAQNSVTYPQNLGFATVGVTVGSTDPAGTGLAPLLNNGANAGKTRATFNAAVPWVGPTDLGDVTGGIAGSPTSIFKSSSPFDPVSPSSVAELGNLSGTNQINFINTLPYGSSLSGPGFLRLSPRLKLSDTTIWMETLAGVGNGDGSVNSEANFGTRFLNIGGGDTIVLPSANNGDIVFGPEPGTMGLMSIGLLGLLGRRRMA